MLHTTIHLYNLGEGRADDHARWFEGPHRDALSGLSGFRSAERFEVAPEQIMADIPQPWGYMTVYDFETAAPALGPLLGEARNTGLVDDANESERIYSYRLYSDWRSGENHRTDQPLSGMSIILANFVAGMEAEYHRWYDDVHMPEVTAVPGHVAMRRGRLAEVQVEPHHYCPGSDIVMCAQQTDDLMFTIRDFSARARGVSPSGIAMAPRSSAGSTARTVHYFRKLGEPKWSGGIAYAGDWSAYPDR